MNTRIFKAMLRFLSKVAFLTNIVFVFVAGMHWLKGVAAWDQALVSNLVITAYFIAAPVNLIVSVWELVLLVRRKTIPVEKWLLVINAVFLLFQIIYFQFT